MSRILILYATREGQTSRIAARIAQVLQRAGHTVLSYPADAIPTELDPQAYAAVIVGASIHYGQHPRSLRKLLSRHSVALATRPSAFFSVSLSGGGPGANPAAAQRYLDTFLRQTAWRPTHTAIFAGALQYSKYSAWKRLLMRLIVGMAGGDTDTARDYEYTDWVAVEDFAAAVAAGLQTDLTAQDSQADKTSTAPTVNRENASR